jgi:amino acid transporter
MTTHPELHRAFGRWDLTGVMINATVGAGIIGLPGQVFALVGNWGVLVCLAGGALMALVATCMAEVGSRFASTGGVYVFIKQAYGPRAGFLAGWLTLVARLLSCAGIANLAAIYAAGVLPWVARPLGRAVFITALIALLTVPVWRGARLSATTYNLFTVTKLTLLLGFCACALPALWAHGMPASPLPPFPNWGQALTLLLFALGGLEATVGSNGEMRQPARDVPFALLAGMAVAVLIYCGVLVAAQAVVPNLAHSTRPVFDGMVRVFGPGAGAAVIIGALISIAGVMFATLFNGPRALFAMAMAGQMPAPLARLHPHSRIPRHAVLVHTAAAWILSLGFGFVGAVTAATLTRLLFYAAIATASVTLQNRGFSETETPLVLPAGPLRAGLVVILIAAVLTQISQREFATVAVLVVVGLIFSNARKDVLF